MWAMVDEGDGGRALRSEISIVALALTSTISGGPALARRARNSSSIDGVSSMQL
jgi:hypothetical protein